MGNDELWDEYLVPGTDVLVNNLGITDKEELKTKESTISFDKLSELWDKPLNLGFGVEHLKALHKYIFGEIYPFAGEFRKVNMQKRLDMHSRMGNFLFVRNEEDFNLYLKELFDDINNQLMYCHDKTQFSGIIAKLYTQLIYCHPFREGNGRTTREFVREFSIAKSKETGIGEMKLRWDLIDKAQLDSYFQIAHIYPSATAELFNRALISKKGEDFKIK